MFNHVPFVPVKAGMDPDPASTESPVFKVRITTFPAGGTSIGILFSHGVMDGEGMIGFMN
jgi:hypothetical protein